MSSSMGDLVGSLKLDGRQFRAGLGDAMSSLGGFAKSLAGIAAPIGAAFGLAHTVEAAGAQIRAQKQLSAVLNATGNASGFADTELFKFAADLQKTTNFADETTIAAMAVLATFKNVRGNTFKEAVKSAQDLTAIMGGDLTSNIRLVGKALTDPLRGMMALRRAGVSLTADQQALIKSQMAGGDLGGAQQTILAGLKGSMGGAAEAMASPLTQVKNIINDVAENLGMRVLPALKVVASAVGEWLGPIADARETFQQTGADIADVVRETVNWINAIGGPLVEAFGQARQALVGVLVTGAVGADTLVDIWGEMASNMMANTMRLIPQTASVFEGVAKFGAAAWNALSTGVSELVADAMNDFDRLKGFVVAIASAIGAALAAAFNLENPIAAAREAFSREFAKIPQQMHHDILFTDMPKAFGDTWKNATEGIADQGGMGKTMENHANALKERVNDALAKVPTPAAVKKAEKKFNSPGADLATQGKIAQQKGAREKLDFADVRSKTGLNQILEGINGKGADHAKATAQNTAQMVAAQQQTNAKLAQIADQTDDEDVMDLLGGV